MSAEQQATRSSWWVYLVSCADGSLYTGIAKDLAVRVAQHNQGRGAKYTRGRGPVVLVYAEEAGAHGDALRREHAIKRMSKVQKARLIATYRQRA